MVTWGQEWDGERWSVEEGEWRDQHGVKRPWRLWDETVAWFFEEKSRGLRNALWDRVGIGSMEASHITQGDPRWFDHIFVSRHLAVNECRYLHRFRKHSDHSAVMAELRPE